MSESPGRLQKVVVAAVVMRDGRVLLAKRAATKRIAPGKYHLPGGHVEFGEHPAEALVREMGEEFGVRVEVGDPVHVFSYLWDGEHTVGIAHAVELKDSPDAMRWDRTDIEECAWVGEEQLGAYLTADDHNFQAAKAGFARCAFRQSPRDAPRPAR